MNIKKILSSVGVGAGAIILGLGIQYAMAQNAGSWTTAPASPPSDNVAAPINVGGGGAVGTSQNYSQYKTGLLGLVSLVVQNLNVASGTVSTPGSVLTNDGSGNASWQPASAGGGGVSQITAGTNITISPTSGTGDVTINAKPANVAVNPTNDPGNLDSGYAQSGSQGSWSARCPTGDVATGYGYDNGQGESYVICAKPNATVTY